MTAAAGRSCAAVPLPAAAGCRVRARAAEPPPPRAPPRRAAAGVTATRLIVVVVWLLDATMGATALPVVGADAASVRFGCTRRGRWRARPDRAAAAADDEADRGSVHQMGGDGGQCADADRLCGGDLSGTLAGRPMRCGGDRSGR